MTYTILRFAKQKGNPAHMIQAHHEREKEKYFSNPDIRKEYSQYNIHLIKPQNSYREEIDRRIKESGCRVRKDSTRFVDTLITASPEFFNHKNINEIKEYFNHALDFMKSKIREDCIFSAVVHLDEHTPHMHLCFVPLTEDNRLSAKEILGNRATLSKWQDDFHKYMIEFYPNLQRGVSSQLTRRKHIPSHIYKSAHQLKKMQVEIEKVLNNTTIFNSTKNSQKAIELIEKWVPMVETFETKINLLAQSLQSEMADKKYLAAELNKRKRDDFGYGMELAKLNAELNHVKKLYSRVPKEVRTDIEERRKHRGKGAER